MDSIKCQIKFGYHVRPDAAHKWILETALVAEGYRVIESVIRDHKRNHSDELIENKHFLPQSKKSTLVVTRPPIEHIGQNAASSAWASPSNPNRRRSLETGPKIKKLALMSYSVSRRVGKGRCGANLYPNPYSRKLKSPLELSLRGFFLSSSGSRTRTCDLWVMSPTSYQLLHPAV